MIGIFLVGVVLCFFCWNLYYKRNWDKDISVNIRFLESYVYEKQQAHMKEQIENRKKLPLPIFEVAFRIPKELLFLDMENTSVSDYTYKRDIYALLGKQRITRTLTLKCLKRGIYEVKNTQYKTHSLLFYQSYTMQEEQNTQLYVYAKRTNVKGLISVFDQLMGEVQCEKKMLEDPFAFCGIREYSITDPMKNLNWKASAKAGTLMVNTFESTLKKRIMIYLDVEDSGIIKQENLVEESICVAATLAQKMIHKSMEVGLSVSTEKNGTIYFPPKSGNKHLISIEQALASLTYKEEQDFFYHTMERKPEDAILVFITKNRDEKRKEAMRRYLKHATGIWILPYEDEMPKEENRTKQLKVITRKVERS